MFEIGISKAELLAELNKAELTPELVAEVIDQNNKKIKMQLKDRSFAKYISETSAKGIVDSMRKRGTLPRI